MNKTEKLKLVEIYEKQSPPQFESLFKITTSRGRIIMEQYETIIKEDGVKKKKTDAQYGIGVIRAKFKTIGSLN